MSQEAVRCDSESKQQQKKLSREMSDSLLSLRPNLEKRQRIDDGLLLSDRDSNDDSDDDDDLMDNSQGDLFVLQPLEEIISPGTAKNRLRRTIESNGNKLTSSSVELEKEKERDEFEHLSTNDFDVEKESWHDVNSLEMSPYFHKRSLSPVLRPTKQKRQLSSSSSSSSSSDEFESDFESDHDDRHSAVVDDSMTSRSLSSSLPSLSSLTNSTSSKEIILLEDDEEDVAALQRRAEIDAEKEKLDLLEVQLHSAMERRAQLQRELDEVNRCCSDLRSAHAVSSGRLRALERESQANVRWDGTDFAWSAAARDTLRRVFKHDRFRGDQEAVLNATMSGQDCFVVMPTGGGKSLLYQLPAVLEPNRMTLVVSPLVALMKDQVAAMKALGVRADMTSGSKQGSSVLSNERMLAPGSLQILYCTPEKLVKNRHLMSQLERVAEAGRLARIAIDEAHCSSSWGHDFRPDYRQLHVLRQQFPGVPIVALTATASDRVVTDVCDVLGIGGCRLFRASVHRGNLRYTVLAKTSSERDTVSSIARFVDEHHPSGSGIVYCFSCADCVTLAEALSREHAITAAPYHGRMTEQDRDAVQRAWMTNQVQCIVATIAFGMGVSKLDVRYVIHHSLSKSLENYYQESGRAGRDGEPADCVLYYRPQDVVRQSSLSYSEHNSAHKLFQMIGYCDLAQQCRKQHIARHFAEHDAPRCQDSCDNCTRDTSEMRFDEHDLVPVAPALLAIVERARAARQKLTLTQLAALWRKKKKKASTAAAASSSSKAKGKRKSKSNKFALPDSIDRAPKALSSVLNSERAVLKLIAEGVLDFYHVNTAYSTNAYVRRGSSASALLGGMLPATLVVVKKLTKDELTTRKRLRDKEEKRDEKKEEGKKKRQRMSSSSSSESSSSSSSSSSSKRPVLSF
jgi:ATP-dependent DNA helicase Q1